MNFDEHTAKRLVLKPAGIAVPQSALCSTPDEALAAARRIGPCVVKAQVPSGKRGKSGGVKIAESPGAAETAAREIFAMTLSGHRVKHVLVEAKAAIEREFYAAVLPDVASRSPVVLFSTEGGMDIEETAERRPEAIRRRIVDLQRGFAKEDAGELLQGLDLGDAAAPLSEVLVKLFDVFRHLDAELIEINPLALLKSGDVVALDCKFALDEAAASRQPDLAKAAVPPQLTVLEKRGAEHGLKFIQLEGDVGLLANGAGLTMTTMDVINHFGGRPANFLEIGGEAYTKAEVALDLVLSNPGVKSLVVNFCGAFARTDVMADGVVRAWEKLRPKVPAFFSIHGTGSEEAAALVRERLNLEPYDLMEDAVKAAVEAAR